MPKPLEDLVKEYSALTRELDSATLQLKEAEQRAAPHDDAVRGEARALGQRVAALRAAGGAGAAAKGGSLDDFKTDPEVGRILGSLDERLAEAAADRQHDHALAVGAWKKALDRAATPEKDLAAEIAARHAQPARQPAAKAGPGNKSVADLLRLQTDVRKKLDPRRAAPHSGEQALQFHDDPDHFRKKRDEWIAAELNTVAAATPPAAAPAATTPASNGQAPAKTDAAKADAAATGTNAPPNRILTAAAFKVAGNQARLLFAAIRGDAAAARAAARRKDSSGVAHAKSSAAQRLKDLDHLVREYDLARAQTGDAGIEKLPNGRQLLAGIKALGALRAKARTLANSISKMH
jgi:hypothetical protein